MLNRFFTSSYSVLILPFLWLGIRYGIGWGSQFDAAIGTQWGVLSHLLLVLLAILFAMNQAHQRREYGFGYLFKTAAKNAILYAVGSVLSIGIYYGVLSNELTVKRQHDIAQIIEETNTPEKIALIKQNNPTIQELSKEQIVQKAIEQTELFTNLKTMLSLAFFCLTILGFVYSLIAAWLFSQFLFAPAKL